jgi:hypothetical protein
MTEQFRAIEWEPIESCPEGVAVEAWVERRIERPDGGYRLPFPVAWRPSIFLRPDGWRAPPEHIFDGRVWFNIEYDPPVGLIVGPSYWRRWPERVSAVFVTPELPRRQAGGRA